MKRYSTISTPPTLGSSFARFLITIALILAGSALVAHFYAEGDPMPGLLSVLAVLFATGLWQTARAVFAVELENCRSKELMRRLDARQDLAVALLQLGTKRRGQGPCGYLYQAICGLYARHQICPGDVDVRPHLESMAYRIGSPVRSAQRWVRQLSMVGLLGTMLGGIIMTTALPQAMQSSSEGLQGASLIALLFAPGGSLAGLGAALVSTFAATLLGGVVLNMLLAVPQEDATRLCRFHAEVLDKCVVSAMKAAAESAKAKEAA
jgi:hypothetical protein